ncbi:MAG: hypothetical protein KDD33_00105 [Bdellovibrionales bacterium]|nr:hypothetical protein [Bdellovibrionales bacterium]
MEKWILVVFLWLAMPASSQAQNKCSDLFRLIDPPLVTKPVEEEILALLESPQVDFAEVKDLVFSSLTGFEPAQILKHQGVHIHNLQTLKPLRPFANVIQTVNWEGGSYFVQKSGGAEKHFNSFWGRFFNIHPQDPAAIAIHQQAGQSGQVWVNLAVGWTRASGLEIQTAEGALKGIGQGLELRTFDFTNEKGENLSLLVLSGLGSQPAHHRLLKSLIHKLQDRYLDSF